MAEQALTAFEIGALRSTAGEDQGAFGRLIRRLLATIDAGTQPEAPTLRDQFAMAAPAKIPDWFKGPDAVYEPYAGIGSECWNKHTDDEGILMVDCPACKEAEKKENERNKRNRLASLRASEVRFFAWRYYYADQMLAARQPEPVKG